MPSAKVKIPGTLFSDHPADLEFRERVRAIVAEEMFCPKAGDESSQPNPERVNVFQSLYGEGECASSGPVVFIDVTGYPTPQRMKNIEDRLGRIRDRTKELLPEGKDVVLVKFHPLEERLWAVG